MDYTTVFSLSLYGFLLLVLMANCSELVTDSWRPNVDGELTERNMCAKLERNGYRCIVKRYAAGSTFPVHTHEMDKMDGPVFCASTLTIYGKEVQLRDGDTAVIPKHVPHSVDILPGDTECVFVDGSKRDEL